MRHKKTPETVYLCGVCNARIVLLDRGEAVKFPHRDQQGFRCDNLLVKYSLSPEGRREETEARWRVFLKEKMREANSRTAQRGEGK